MIAVPILSLLDPRLAPVPEILVILPLTVAMAWKERHAMDLHGVGWIIAGRFPGAAIGVALLAVATQRTLDIFIGAVVIGAVAIIGTGIHVQRTPATKFGAGVAGGITGLVSSIGGPPVALLYSAEEAARIRSTLAAIFAIGVSITVTVRFATGNVTMTDLTVSAFLFPAVAIGYLVSLRFRDRIPRSAVRAAILIVSAAAGTALIVRAVIA